MGFSNLGGCYSIHTYEAAEAHWDRTPEPGRPGSSLRNKWVGARPLDDARKWHYRIEHHTYPGQDYYDVCLYHTTMVRYHRPEADGSRRGDYTNHSSNLSKQFMRRMGFGPEMRISGVVVPVEHKELGTTIWFDKDGRILTDRSHHAPVFKYVTSPEQKAWRKTLKDSTRTLVTLFEMGMQLPEPAASSWGRHAGAPFRGVNINWDTKQALRSFDGEMHEGTTHLQVEALKQVWDACLQVLVDKRDYGATPPNWGTRTVYDYKAPTPQEVTRSWYTQIEKLCCRERAASERIPDWPTAGDLPRKYHF